MNEEARLLVSLWEAVSDHIPAGSRQEAGASMIRVMMEYGHDLALLHEAESECPFLDRALDQVSDEEGEEFEEDLDIENY